MLDLGEPITEDEAVWDMKLERALAAGLGATSAFDFANMNGDIRLLEKLVAQGCDPELARQIAS